MVGAMAFGWRRLKGAAFVVALACGSASGPVPCDDCSPCENDACVPDPVAAGLVVAGGQNAAFLADTFALHTWYVDSAGSLLGVFPTDVRWTSGDAAIVEPIGDSLFVARALGTAVLTAEAVVSGATFQAALEFHVIPGIEGRLVWGRAPELGEAARLVHRDIPGGGIVPAPSFGPADFTGIGSPALSPDRRRVAIQAPRPASAVANHAIYLVDLLTSSVTILTNAMFGDQIAPRWSTDGQLILFAAPAEDGWAIWSMPWTGGVPQVRARLGWGGPVFFDVSAPDGRMIVLLGNGLWEVALDSGLMEPVAVEPANRFHPRVSPDGELIAYIGDVPGTEGSGVLVVPRAGGAVRELLPQVFDPVQPILRTRSALAYSSPEAWTPDGVFLIVTWFVHPTLVEATTGTSRQLVRGGELYAVSRDGQLRIRLTRWRWGDVQADFR